MDGGIQLGGGMLTQQLLEQLMQQVAAAEAEQSRQGIGFSTNFAPNPTNMFARNPNEIPPSQSPSTPAQLANEYMNSMMANQAAGQQGGNLGPPIPVPGGMGASQLPSSAMPQAMNQPGVPSGDYDQDKLERRKAALGRIAEARANQPRQAPMQSPFDLIRNTAVQGINQMVGESFSPGLGGLTPEMVMAYQNRMPMLSQLSAGAGVPTGGGGHSGGWGRQQAAQKQITIKDLDDSQLNWYNAQIKTKLADIAERAAQEKDANRKRALQQQHDRLLEQQRQFDAELDIRESKVAQGDRGLDLREAGQKTKAEADAAKAVTEKDKSFHARLDAITNPLDPTGRPVGLSPDAIPLLEMLKIQYEALGETKYLPILDKLIEQIRKIPPKTKAPAPATNNPIAGSGVTS